MVKGVKNIVLIEAAVVLSAFSFLVKVNRDGDFRHRLYSSPRFSFMLEGYYKCGEYIYGADYTTREIDQEIWRRQGKLD